MKSIVILLLVSVCALAQTALPPPPGLKCELVSGVIPVGLALDQGTCRLSGKPTDNAGVYTFTLKASAPGFLPAQKQYSLTVLPDQQLVFDTQTPLANVIKGFSYDVTLQFSTKQITEAQMAVIGLIWENLRRGAPCEAVRRITGVPCPD